MVYHVSKNPKRKERWISDGYRESYYGCQFKNIPITDLEYPEDNPDWFKKLIFGEAVRNLNLSNWIDREEKRKSLLMDLFEHEKFDVVIHLAAQAGWGTPLSHSWGVYWKVIFQAFLNILRAARFYSIKHLVYCIMRSSSMEQMKKCLSRLRTVDHPIVCMP